MDDPFADPTRASTPRRQTLADAERAGDEVLAEAERTMTLRFGRVGGLLLVGAALAAVPSTLLLHPRPPLTTYLIVFAAVVVGLVCAIAPWDRVARGWLNVPAALAIGLVALAARYVDISYELYYMLIAVYTAYVFPRWSVLRWHLALIAFALLLPLTGGSATASETLRQMLLVLPSVVIIGGIDRLPAGATR